MSDNVTDWDEPIYDPEELRGGRYPPEIECKVEMRVDRSDDNAFNSDMQHECARRLIDHWPMEFRELANQFGNSHDLYSKVYYAYFGPVNSPYTFEGIRKQWGTYRTYLRRLKAGDVPGPDGVPSSPVLDQDKADPAKILESLGLAPEQISDRDERMARIGYDIGYLRGQEAGN